MNEIIEQLSKGRTLIQTHISWVLLDDEFAYKIKKSVKFPFIDYSTLDKRKDLSKVYIERYIELSKDPQINDLIDFYKCSLAGVRAKVAALQFEQTEEAEQKDNITLYLDLAENYAKSL